MGSEMCIRDSLPHAHPHIAQSANDMLHRVTGRVEFTGPVEPEPRGRKKRKRGGQK